ncbi:MAG: helix-turn-helix domain-containing protein [Vulcanimicrobiaceae bacterium]
MLHPSRDCGLRLVVPNGLSQVSQPRSDAASLGRRPALSPAQVAEAKKMLKRGESPNHVARVLRVGRSTLYRAIGQVSS